MALTKSSLSFHHISREFLHMQAINFTVARDKLASVLDPVTSGVPVMITQLSTIPVVVIDAEQCAKIRKLPAECDFE